MKRIITASILAALFFAAATPVFASHPCRSKIFCSQEVMRQTHRMQLDHDAH